MRLDVVGRPALFRDAGRYEAQPPSGGDLPRLCPSGVGQGKLPSPAGNAWPCVPRTRRITEGVVKAVGAPNARAVRAVPARTSAPQDRQFEIGSAASAPAAASINGPALPRRGRKRARARGGIGVFREGSGPAQPIQTEIGPRPRGL